MCTASSRRPPQTPRSCEGVGRGALPRRLKNIAWESDAGKVCRRGAVFNFPFLMEMFRLHIYGLLVLDQVHWP